MTPTRRPIVIEHVHPAVDDGRYAAKRVVGETLAVSADIFKEGHDLLAARIRYRARGDAEWRRSNAESFECHHAEVAQQYLPGLVRVKAPAGPTRHGHGIASRE